MQILRKNTAGVCVFVHFSQFTTNYKCFTFLIHIFTFEIVPVFDLRASLLFIITIYVVFLSPLPTLC